MPLPSAVTVASGVPSPSVSICTVLLASAVPVSVVPLLSSTDGWAGGAVSSVKSNAALAGPVLPAASVAVAVSE